MTPKLKFDEPIILIGGGDIGAKDLQLVQPFAETAVAADGGANNAVAMGLDLSAIIGDMDSISNDIILQNQRNMVSVTEQNSTDFEKCIYTVAAPLFLCLGFLGGRFDHELAALNVIAKYRDKPIILVGVEDISLICPRDFSVALPSGSRVSVFPLGDVKGVTSTGLKWEMLALDLQINGKIATSNKMETEHLTLQHEQGDLLLILPRKALPAILASI